MERKERHSTPKDWKCIGGVESFSSQIRVYLQWSRHRLAFLIFPRLKKKMNRWLSKNLAALKKEWS